MGSQSLNCGDVPIWHVLEGVAWDFNYKQVEATHISLNKIPHFFIIAIRICEILGPVMQIHDRLFFWLPPVIRLWNNPIEQAGVKSFYKINYELPGKKLILFHVEKQICVRMILKPAHEALLVAPVCVLLVRVLATVCDLFQSWKVLWIVPT